MSAGATKTGLSVSGISQEGREGPTWCATPGPMSTAASKSIEPRSRPRGRAKAKHGRSREAKQRTSRSEYLLRQKEIYRNTVLELVKEGGPAAPETRYICIVY